MIITPPNLTGYLQPFLHIHRLPLFHPRARATIIPLRIFVGLLIPITIGNPNSALLSMTP